MGRQAICVRRRADSAGADRQCRIVTVHRPRGRVKGKSMAKLSDREAERFIAQASPDAARAMEITRLEVERQEVARMKRAMWKETRPNISAGEK